MPSIATVGQTHSRSVYIKVTVTPSYRKYGHCNGSSYKHTQYIIFTHTKGDNDL